VDHQMKQLRAAGNGTVLSLISSLPCREERLVERLQLQREIMQGSGCHRSASGRTDLTIRLFVARAQ